MKTSDFLPCRAHEISLIMQVAFTGSEPSTMYSCALGHEVVGSRLSALIFPEDVAIRVRK